MHSIKDHTKLIKQCLKGKRKAQFELYEIHKVYLYGICMRYGKTKFEAEDMLQEGFYKILRDLKQYKGQVPFQAWIRKVIINSCLMHIRKYKKLSYSELFESEADAVLGFDVELLSSNRAKAIIHLIQTLPENQQTVFNLKGIDGYSFAEISSMLDIKEATLRSHYLRARKRLQHLLNKELN